MSQAWGMSGCMSYMSYVCGTASHESFVAQWLEHPTGAQRVIGSITVADSDIFLSSIYNYAPDMPITSFLISSPRLKFTIFLFFITFAAQQN